MSYSEGIILHSNAEPRYTILHILSSVSGYQQMYLFNKSMHVMPGDFVYYSSLQDYKIDSIEIVASYFRKCQSKLPSMIMASVSSISPILYKNIVQNDYMYSMLFSLLKTCNNDTDNKQLILQYFHWESSMVNMIIGLLPNNLDESYNMLSEIFYSIPSPRRILHNQYNSFMH